MAIELEKGNTPAPNDVRLLRSKWIGDDIYDRERKVNLAVICVHFPKHI